MSNPTPVELLKALRAPNSPYKKIGVLREFHNAAADEIERLHGEIGWLRGRLVSSESAPTVLLVDEQSGVARAAAEALARSPDKVAQDTPRTDALKIPSEALLLLGQKGVPEQIVKAILTLGENARKLEHELEIERSRLAACGVAALGYHPQEGISAEYKSGSLDDVLRLREKFDELESTHSSDTAIPLDGEACARIYNEASGVAMRETQGESYESHLTALVHVYAAGQRSRPSASTPCMRADCVDIRGALTVIRDGSELDSVVRKIAANTLRRHTYVVVSSPK